MKNNQKEPSFAQIAAFVYQDPMLIRMIERELPFLRTVEDIRQYYIALAAERIADVVAPAVTAHKKAD